MAHYRVYLLDDYGNIFVGCDAEYTSDAEALARAADVLAAVEHIADQMEVWSGRRRVGSVAASIRKIDAKPTMPWFG